MIKAIQFVKGSNNKCNTTLYVDNLKCDVHYAFISECINFLLIISITKSIRTFELDTQCRF